MAVRPIMRGAKEAGWAMNPEALARLIVKTYVDTYTDSIEPRADRWIFQRFISGGR